MLIENAKNKRGKRNFDRKHTCEKFYFKFSCYTIDWIIFIPILDNRETIYVQLNKKELIGFSVDPSKVLYLQTTHLNTQQLQ